jgi:hypothetical protein
LGLNQPFNIARSYLRSKEINKQNFFHRSSSSKQLYDWWQYDTSYPMSSNATEKIDDIALSVERLIARNEATLGDYEGQEVSVPEYSSESEAGQLFS